jgi:predicted metalloprotease with PDZ domain
MHKSYVGHRTFLLLFLGIGLFSIILNPALSQGKKDLKISYLIDVHKPHAHLFKVTINVDNVRTKYLDFALPAWMPGYNRVLNFARNIQEFEAYDGKKGKINFEKLDKQTWRIFKGQDQTMQLKYKVYANDLHNINIASHIDETHAFFNGAAVFFYVVGAKDSPVVLTVSKPETWKIATGLEKTSRPDTFKAQDYDHLIDCPTEIGTFAQYEFWFRDKRHSIVIYGLEDFDASFLVDDISKIVKTSFRLFGNLPYEDYTFIFHLTDRERKSGVEHANSTVISFNKDDFHARRMYDDFLSVTAHEFFHLWNIKRIKPLGWGPFDYSKEAYTKSHWFTEGVTSYYTTLNLVRAGLWTKEKYFQDMAQKIAEFEAKPGKKLMSLEKASWDIILLPDNARDTTVSYYIKGAIVIFMLDLEMRRPTNNKKGLDDVLQYLNEHYAKKGVAYQNEELLQIINSITNSDLSNFYGRFISGTDDLPYDDIFGSAGLKLIVNKDKAAPYFGIEGERTLDNFLKVKYVKPGSPAYDAGIDDEDILLALENRRISGDNFQDLLNQCQVGDVVTVTLYHRDHLLNKKVSLGQIQKAHYQIKEIEEPSRDQLEVQKSLFWQN